MSGKGGVGKSSIAYALAYSLSMSGRKVGCMDADLTSSSITRLAGIEPKMPTVDKKSVIPLDHHGIKVISTSMFTGSEETPVFFKGEKKRGWIEQFINRVAWGDIEYLVIDCPPGHSDEVIEILTSLKGKIYKVVIVTVPQKLALNSVQKTIKLCQKLRVPILGLVVNMYALICNVCNNKIKFADETNVNKMAEKFGVQVVSRIPVVLEQENNPYSILEFINPIADELTKRRLF